MTKIKMRKPDGRIVEINDIDDAAEIMMRDGWVLDSAVSTSQDEKPVKTRRRRSQHNE